MPFMASSFTIVFFLSLTFLQYNARLFISIKLLLVVQLGRKSNSMVEKEEEDTNTTQYFLIIRVGLK